MKKNLLGIILLFLTLHVFGQDGMPSYPDVLKYFFNRYVVENEAEDFVNFAKKKTGWFVQKINRVNKDSVLSEAALWTVKKNAYEDVDSLFTTGVNEDVAELNISNYLNGDAAYLWKEYERCRYNGYVGWEQDMINDFGSVQTLQDTLLEGLARAYSSLAGSYLWFSIERKPDHADSMQRRLGPAELPSEERVNKVVELISKSVATFDRLLKQNPGYKTTVGNIYLKKFNEYMHGYNLLIMAMQDQKAKELLLKAELAEPYITQAKNFLNSCDKHAILFTYGDNDTYQVWYVQEKENYRKDVTVINNSLFGLPIYIDMLKKKKMVDFSMPLSYYSTPGIGIASFRQPADSNKNKEVGLKIFLENIFSKKTIIENYDYSAQPQVISIYETDKLRLPLNTIAFNKLSAIKTNAAKISFSLTNYTNINDLLVFDIANANINTRPIYFTNGFPGHFDDDLIQQGIVYRLFPMENANKEMIAKKEIKALEKFADSIYKPVTTFNMNGQKHISYDGNDAFFVLNAKIADYYCDNNNIPAAAARLKKAESILTGITADNMPVATVFLNSYFKVDTAKLKNYSEIYTQYLYDKFAHPASLTGYLSKDKCSESIHKYYDYLKSKGIESDVMEAILDDVDRN